MSNPESYQQTACNLCSLNCGIEVEVEDRRFRRIRGDRSHPSSRGYLCQKASRLDSYQNHATRLRHPLRRRSDGSFERIDWDTAIHEVAERLVGIRDTHGGHAIAYYGGGGQGNHLGGAYAVPFRAALETPYLYNSLAQEKTGDFWVNGKLFGKQTCHVTESLDETDYALILGANPWQAHGFPRARKVLREIASDPDRTLVVVDPRRTKSAELADLHLQVRPGSDAFLLAAMLGTIVQENLVDRTFLEQRTVGFEELERHIRVIPVDDFATRSGVDPGLVRRVARGFASARSASSRHDLGLEHSLHSTLNTYLEKLLCLLTGNFGTPGGNNLHTQFMPLIGHSKEPEEGGATTRVTGMREISKFFPPNLLPAEIDTDHPDRVRAVIVDSSNPLQSAADTRAYRRAFDKLDLLVAIDVAETETVEKADYVLPAPTQYEKWEATFFTLGFPTNYFHLRRPILEPAGDTLAEPEIYHRLIVAMGALPARMPLLEAAARLHRKLPRLGVFPLALAAAMKLRPHLRKLTTSVLYATYGRTLPDGAAAAAVVWGASRFYAHRYARQIRRAGIGTSARTKAAKLGEALFNEILERPTAVAISTHEHEEMWELVRHPDKKIRLEVPEMLSELDRLEGEKSSADPDYPFVLAAGERRRWNANQIFRDPAWRRGDQDGALRTHPDDLKELGFEDGQLIVCESATAAIEMRIQADDSMQRGCLSAPHGYGMSYPSNDSDSAQARQSGPSINTLTASDHCDPIAMTPYHKYVPVRLRPVD